MSLIDGTPEENAAKQTAYNSYIHTRRRMDEAEQQKDWVRLTYHEGIAANMEARYPDFQEMYRRYMDVKGRTSRQGLPNAGSTDIPDKA